MDIDLSSFRWGIEHEFAAVDATGEVLDFSNTTFEQMDRVIERLPVFDSDYPGLRVGDLGIKSKRWYIEGFERFSANGEYLRTDPKGFEIRTPVSASLDIAIDTLRTDVERWDEAAHGFGYRRARVSLNPLRGEFVPHPPLNAWELGDRSSPEEQTAHIHMLTYGPDISFSHPALTTEQTIDIGRKLTAYSPFIVPFSFSSPFYRGELWGGYSRRTFYRTGARPSVLVFVEHDHEITPTSPTLTDKARLPAEVGRIEFKAFDCPPDIELFRALGTLLLGIALDETLPERLQVPDAVAHQRAASHAFDDESVRTGAQRVLEAAHAALPAEKTAALEPLQAMLTARRTPAHDMIERYRTSGDIVAAIL